MGCNQFVLYAQIFCINESLIGKREIEYWGKKLRKNLAYQLHIKIKKF